ncbi:MAG: methylmalonyl Co-A mutase-associated GTPase MeaB [Halobacteriovoraceae bacterium]|jgi:LAO/AO transport system kinase|nr:methylmalonyl Co-A mutase-associated GTPase MeaB [Halobacteriovoraceae bacterium]
MSIDLKALQAGNPRALAKAITLIESKKESDQAEAQQLLNDILKKNNKSLRIGISGIPGVGKSTFIESFGLNLIDAGQKVAVLAVDPSSPLSGGSIMGDKTRMDQLAANQNAYIRPSPTTGHLGGVAAKTRECMLLCEAAGFDIILVETVGVGQSEYDVASMVDFFLVLMVPTAGDELQGIKKGILELADALVVNKADGELLKFANSAKQNYENALSLVSHPSFWSPQVKTCSALENTGLDEVWKMIKTYQDEAIENNYFTEKRSSQNLAWMKKIIQSLMDQKLQNNPKVSKLLVKLEKEVQEGMATPLLAAEKIIKELFK